MYFAVACKAGAADAAYGEEVAETATREHEQERQQEKYVDRFQPAPSCSRERRREGRLKLRAMS